MFLKACQRADSCWKVSLGWSGVWGGLALLKGLFLQNDPIQAGTEETEAAPVWVFNSRGFCCCWVELLRSGNHKALLPPGAVVQGFLTCFFLSYSRVRLRMQCSTV